MVPIAITVNGKVRKAHVEPRTLLVHFLREHLNLTGTHVGCDTSQCGACTVLLNGEAVRSCLLLAVQGHEAQISTVEGLAHGEQLHPLQEAFRLEHGLQCGFCTPGMLMSALAFLRETPHPTEPQVRQALAGNLCRCTGYQSIVAAVLRAAQAGVQ